MSTLNTGRFSGISDASVPYQVPEHLVLIGERHDAMKSYVAHRRALGAEEEELRESLEEFFMRYCESSAAEDEEADQAEPCGVQEVRQAGEPADA